MSCLYFREIDERVAGVNGDATISKKTLLANSRCAELGFPTGHLLLHVVLQL